MITGKVSEREHTEPEPRINIPEFKHSEIKTSKSLAQNNQLKLDSERAAKQVQNDKIIVNGLSEALISGREELPFYCWTNAAGLVVIGVGAATGQMLIMVIGLMIKIRWLTISILLLERVAGTHAGKIPDLVFDFFEVDQSGKEYMTAKVSLDTLIRNISQENWSYISLTLIAAYCVSNDCRAC